jgi:hypothetical protein
MAQFGAPNFLAAIDAYEAGARRAERNRLADLAEQGRVLQGKALSGDQNALAQLGQVDPQAYMQTSQFTTEQKKARLGEFLSAAYGAKTPEQWQSVVERFKAQGHQFGPGEDAWENRGNLLRQGMSVADQMKLDFDREKYDAEVGRWEREFKANQDYRRAQIDIERAKLGAAAPDLVEIFDDKTGQPYKARWNPQTQQYDRVGGVKAPSGTSLEVGPDGTVSFTQGMGKPLTESQSKDAVYATRMTDAAPVIDAMGEKLLSLGENVGGNVPLVGNYIKSPEYQVAEQAAGQWRQGFLRKDSGATITKEETADTNQLYIPQPGDKPPVLLRKAEARRAAMKGIRAGLSPQAVMNMQKQGIDIDKVINAPLPGAEGGKSDKGGAPRRRRFNPSTGELE